MTSTYAAGSFESQDGFQSINFLLKKEEEMYGWLTKHLW